MVRKSTTAEIAHAIRPRPVQQRLIAILEEHDGPLDTIELAAGVYQINPDETGQTNLSAAQLVSVRRALRGLANRGVIGDLGRRGWHDGRQRWASVKVTERYRQARAEVLRRYPEGADT